MPQHQRERAACLLWHDPGSMRLSSVVRRCALHGVIVARDPSMGTTTGRITGRVIDALGDGEITAMSPTPLAARASTTSLWFATSCAFGRMAWSPVRSSSHRARTERRCIRPPPGPRFVGRRRRVSPPQARSPRRWVLAPRRSLHPRPGSRTPIERLAALAPRPRRRPSAHIDESAATNRRAPRIPAGVWTSAAAHSCDWANWRWSIRCAHDEMLAGRSPAPPAPFVPLHSPSPPSPP